MLALKLLFTLTGAVLLMSALFTPLYSLYLRVMAMRRKSAEPEFTPELETKPQILWRKPIVLAIAACVPLLIAASIVVVPSGMGGVRISQMSGTLPGTLYPGVHLVTPLIDSVQIFDLRDHLFTAGLGQPGAGGRAAVEKAGLEVQSREGLNIGLGVTVRYRLDPSRLAGGQAHLPQPADKQLVPPVVASAWRELAPQYTVREIFSSRREEVREKAAAIIRQKLAQDGIVVEEVMLSEIQLPEEYAKGLEGLLLKEQEDDQLGIQTEIQQKQVRIAELQAEAEAKQKVKEAEGDAQSKVVEAKGDADAMQYTLPLKQKQIEQSKLEAEARKEATIQNAEADAEAKVIDSKAELQRRNLLADAEASRIRLLAAANAERMKSEADLLNRSPLLINKIVAERLSDKIQMVMVPSDGKFFFANDVFKGMGAMPAIKQEMDNDSSPDKKPGQ